MAKKAKAYVLDSWAIIAYLEDEPSAEQVEELVATAHEEQIPIYMSVINVGEVWYTLAREVSEEEANAGVKMLSDLRIQFENVDWELTMEAARFKAQTKMSYADAFAAALAKVKKADLVTGDNEFKPLDGQIKISWV
ncbi:MAG: PIN domain-containing protein [Chloroflexi bacterium]|nr:PIN domain-containing protein [Chloroflexota bacterium]MBI3339895.1 PIN domain-containing protein [Chloroflexota bacterium]